MTQLVHHDASAGGATVTLTVRDISPVAEDCVALTLARPDGTALPEWAPGAHIDLVLGDDLVRQYSLCGDPNDTTAWRLGVLREPDSRGGSQFVHDHLHAGSAVSIRGPRNHFPLVQAENYVFIAGGIGITPILAMIAAAESAGTPWRLLYGGRRRTSMAFLDEVERFRDAVTVHPQDEYGLLDLDGFLGQADADSAVYCCGPEPLIAAVETVCAARDLSLHVERFTPKPLSGTPANHAFEVVCAASGITVAVPADSTILAAVREAGIEVLSSCSEGTCGTCEADVVEGEPDHRDSVLTPQERQSGESMMICVSRCLGKRLVLDL